MLHLDDIASAVTSRIQSFWIASTVLTPECQSIVRQLRDVGAVTPARAQRFHPTSRRSAVAFTRLQQLEIVREPTRAHYYLDLRALGEIQEL